ncbi:hypothetical protein [Photobacterium carnosum]|uniref:hypothetical protein n=1 Tax=Photobacterium carnosum TaxID=2023717 RepID=UPI00128E462B|nr:hypothetical protein [Photobacterium carnosum]KAE8176055.1 hypothetical protein CIT27_14955 [Photobacterium carnosum]MBY3789747.1 hypothetical protein [Photobacterium carnosum]MCD9495990.1 hypothetical protein [Photobacterium carnosum]MCD9499913.1 hypothetical protein [Photobacterium carnosum]MCD9515876.1 hypothetical protein [Photobacterium carnosum]
MRPASPVRYASTPRSPSRLRASSHAPQFKVSVKKTPTTEIHLTGADAQLDQQQIVPELLLSQQQQR